MTNPSLKGYIVYPTYRLVEGDDKKQKKALVYLFGRLENGESFLIIKPYRPYFYVKRANIEVIDEKLEKTLTLFNAYVEDSDFKNFNDEQVSKIILDIPGDVPKLRKILEEEHRCTCYEADIRFYQRFLIDHNIKSTLEVSGKWKKGEYVDRIYEDPVVKGAEWNPELKILSIDIESDSHAKHLYCISLYTPGIRGQGAFERVIILSHELEMGKPLEHAISVNTEKDLLEKFQELVISIDPDVIIGWNVIDFDLNFLKNKFDEHKIPFVLGRTAWPCKLDIVKDFMRDSSADFPGRMVLDGIQVLKTSYIKLGNYKLDTAAEEFLGEKKLIGHEHKGSDIEHYFQTDQQKLVDYNLKDSEFVYRILFKTGSMQLTIQRSLITGMTLERVRASVASLDSLFLREAQRRKIVLNNSAFGEKEEAAKGGFVMQSVPGLYEYVIVCDFKSLYPSIIRTYNIDPYSFVEKKDIPKDFEKLKDKFIVAANGAVFKNQDGILPHVISEVWKKRDEAKRNKATAETIYGLKIIMNSFYGVLGNPSCRFFNPDMSNAITHTAQAIIKLTIKKVEELGYKVIYSDTDSVFLVSRAKNNSDARAIGKKIEDHINEYYTAHIKKEHHRESSIELQFDKLFKIFLMPTVRGSDVGAKKRYAGIIVKDDDSEELHFTGMEFVRGDWTDLAKKFQGELFELLFNKQGVSDYIKTFVDDLRNGEYDELLVYRKNINKPLNEYTKTTPPHVKAARQLKKLTSNQIRYIVTTEGPEPLELLKHKPDYEHYIDKQIKPIADTVLSAYGKNFNDIIQNSSQSTLFGY